MTDWREVAKDFKDDRDISLILTGHADPVDLIRDMAIEIMRLRCIVATSPYGAAETGRMAFRALEEWRAYSEKLRGALQWYADGGENYETHPAKEFGCGCCAHAMMKDEEGEWDDYWNDPDDSKVQGRLARLALAIPRPGTEGER